MRFQLTISSALIVCMLLTACTKKTEPTKPKFKGSLWFLSGDKPDGSELVELIAGPDSTYQQRTVISGILEAAASPDRTRLLYASKDGITLKYLDTGAVKPLIKGEAYCLAWATDSKHFSYKQQSGEAPAKLFLSDLDGKTRMIWEDLVTDRNAAACPNWVGPDRLIFDRLLGVVKKKGAEAPKPNTTTMAVLGDGVKLTDTNRKWSIEGFCPTQGVAFLRSADQNELLIAKNIDNLKSISPTKGPCTACRFLGFAAQSCVPFFIEDSSSTSSEVFSLNPMNWQRLRAGHIGQPFSTSARAVISSSARLMVVGDIHRTLVLVDTESGDVIPFFAEPAGPTEGVGASPRPVVWIEK